MQVLEMIELRTGTKNRGEVDRFLEDWLGKIKASEQKQRIRVYHNALLETDISIHLFREWDAETIDVSPTGSQLAIALKDFGLVNYNIWIEQKQISI